MSSLSCVKAQKSAEDVLISALDLRQQVLFTSCVMEEDVKYSPELVQAVLFRALEIGIKNDIICANVTHLLKKHSVTDEELIKGVNDAMLGETE